MKMQRVNTGWQSWHYRSSKVVCAHCEGELPVQRHQGNPRKWCSETCRVAAYRLRNKR